MLVHIANMYDAPRRTVTAGSAIPLGAVTVATNVAGVRTVNAVADGGAAGLLAGNYGVAIKVSERLLQVSSSSGVPADWGTRVVAIASGDSIVECARGSILEYEPIALHASLDPNRSGALPVAGAALGIKDGLFCTAGTTSAIVSPVVGRVFDIVGGKIRVELV